MAGADCWSREPASSFPRPSSSGSSPRSTFASENCRAWRAVLVAVKPVVIAIIVQAFWTLSRTAVKSWWLGIIGMLGAVAYVFRVHELLILLGAALLASAAVGEARCECCGSPRFRGSSAHRSPLPVTLTRLFLTFLKIGSVSVWQRIRAAGISARRLRRSPALAHPETTARRGRGRADHAGAGVHDCNLHRLSSSPDREGLRSQRWQSFFQPSCWLRSAGRWSSRVRESEDRLGGAGWRDRGFLGVDGRRRLATRTERDYELADGIDRHRECGVAVALPGEFGVVDFRIGDGGRGLEDMK